MSILHELEGLLTTPEKFSATSGVGFFPALPKDQLKPVFPLLDLLNSDAATPTFPLTIPAIENLLKPVGTEELHTLNSQLLAALKGIDPLNATNHIDPIDALKQIFSGLKGVVDQVVPQVLNLLRDQLVIGASLISIVNALKPKNLEGLFKAQAQYFFGSPGYTTVADEVIAPPKLPTLQPANLNTIGGFLSKKTGEQYVRDLTRVGFEALANEAWSLEARYAKIDAKAGLPDGNPEKIKSATKAKTWFKGFADFAEASVTSAVEQALSQGGGPVQSNPLFAASVATAAGTSARKSSQHIFLREIAIK
jgi:hypothetical protein